MTAPTTPADTRRERTADPPAPTDARRSRCVDFSGRGHAVPQRHRGAVRRRPDRAARRVRHRGRPAAAARARCCGSPPAWRPASEGTVALGTKRIGYVFQDATLLPWRTVQANVELLAELNKRAEAGRAPSRRRRRSTWSGSTGFEKHLPAAAVRRHADAGLAGPLAHPGPRAVPVRRAVRRAGRDHPRAAERRAAAALRRAALRRAVHHPLGVRGGVPVHPGGGDERAARAGSSTPSRSPSDTRATPTSASPPSSPRSPARSPTPCGEATRDRHRRQAGRRGRPSRRSPRRPRGRAGAEPRSTVYGPPLVAFAVILVVWYALAAYLAVASAGRRSCPTRRRIIVDSFAPSDPRDSPITGDLLAQPRARPPRWR